MNQTKTIDEWIEEIRENQRDMAEVRLSLWRDVADELDKQVVTFLEENK